MCIDVGRKGLQSSSTGDHMRMISGMIFGFTSDQKPLMLYSAFDTVLDLAWPFGRLCIGSAERACMQQQYVWLEAQL